MSELEAEQEAARSGAAALASLPGMDSTVLSALTEAGLESPAAVARAGRERLAAIAEVGDRADKLVAAAEEWVLAHAPPAAPEPQEVEPERQEPAGADGGTRAE